MFHVSGLVGQLSDNWKLSLLLPALMLSACATRTHTAGDVPVEYFSEYENCKQQALSLDASAGRQQSPAQYAAAAGILERCVVDGEPSDSVAPEELMRLSALSIVNSIKAGEIETARERFSVFKHRYSDHDLYFSDNTSFIDTIEVLLDADRDGYSPRRVMNARHEVLSEQQRRHYWQTH